MVRKALIIASLALASISPANAKIKEFSKVRYETKNGYSQWYDMQVSFLMGVELNQATASFKYDGLRAYGVIFFSQNGAAVIKLDGTFICGFEFEESCLPFGGRAKGRDQDGTKWEICTGDFC